LPLLREADTVVVSSTSPPATWVSPTTFITISNEVGFVKSVRLLFLFLLHTLLHCCGPPVSFGGETADEAARVCIDSGDFDPAYYWYEIVHETGLKEPDIKSARRDLWEFRSEHAQARIAARRGNHAEAQKHVAARKGNPRQGNQSRAGAISSVPSSKAHSMRGTIRRRSKDC
jgi:hypothetical protein